MGYVVDGLSEPLSSLWVIILSTPHVTPLVLVRPGDTGVSQTVIADCDRLHTEMSRHTAPCASCFHDELADRVLQDNAVDARTFVLLPLRAVTTHTTLPRG